MQQQPQPVEVARVVVRMVVTPGRKAPQIHYEHDDQQPWLALGMLESAIHGIKGQQAALEQQRRLEAPPIQIPDGETAKKLLAVG